MVKVMKFKVEEILKEIDIQRPINSTTIGVCHPNTYKALFKEIKDSYIKKDLRILDSTAVKENHILLISTKIDGDEISVNNITFPVVQIGDIPIVPIEY